MPTYETASNSGLVMDALITKRIHNVAYASKKCGICHTFYSIASEQFSVD